MDVNQRVWEEAVSAESLFRVPWPRLRGHV
jgi:hypothetical protein